MEIDIQFKPPKHIIIHNIAKVTFQEMLDYCTLELKQGDLSRHLNWTDGILYDIGNFDDRTKLIERAILKRVVHIKYVVFVDTEQPYKQYLTNAVNSVVVSVIKMQSEYHRKVIEFVLKQKI